MEKIEIFYLFGQKIIGVRDNNKIKDAFEIIPIPAKDPRGNIMFVPMMNEITDISIENMSMIPIRSPMEEELEIYKINMSSKSPITSNVNPEMVEKLKKLHDAGLMKG